MLTVYPALSRVIEGCVLWKSISGRSIHTINDNKNYLILFEKWSKDPDIDQIPLKTTFADALLDRTIHNAYQRMLRNEIILDVYINR
jgi:hypothetical protein